MEKIGIKMGMFVTGIFVLALLSAAIPASATTVEDCTAAVEQLKANTSVATFTNQKDLDGLLLKLDDALAKLGLNKFSDAVQKLTNYRDKVLALISQGKIAPSADGTVTPQNLVNDANATIACIQNIGIP